MPKHVSVTTVPYNQRRMMAPTATATLSRPGMVTEAAPLPGTVVGVGIGLLPLSSLVGSGAGTVVGGGGGGGGAVVSASVGSAGCDSVSVCSGTSSVGGGSVAVSSPPSSDEVGTAVSVSVGVGDGSSSSSLVVVVAVLVSDVVLLVVVVGLELVVVVEVGEQPPSMDGTASGPLSTATRSVPQSSLLAM